MLPKISSWYDFFITNYSKVNLLNLCANEMVSQGVFNSKDEAGKHLVDMRGEHTRMSRITYKQIIFSETLAYIPYKF